MTRVTIAACAALLCANTPCANTALAAGTPQQQCEAAKLKAQGTFQACLKTSSGNVILGKADASASCQKKFDAALAKAEKKGACRYLDNGDGTVSDLNTGLMWEKKDNLDGAFNADDLHDADNLYTWSSGPPYAPDGTVFTSFLATMNGGTSSDGTTVTGCFANHCDWRLPTIVELAGIIACGSSSACVDQAFGQTQPYYYWSATPFTIPSGAWDVNFSFGQLGAGTKTGSIYVRAVRGGL